MSKLQPSNLEESKALMLSQSSQSKQRKNNDDDEDEDEDDGLTNNDYYASTKSHLKSLMKSFNNDNM